MGRRFFTADSERHVREGSGRRASLSLSLHSGAWREGSCADDSDRRVTEGSGNEAFLFTGAPSVGTAGTWHGGLGQFLHWAGTCSRYIFLLRATCSAAALCGATTL
jgi:hypothetical protein